MSVIEIVGSDRIKGDCKDKRWILGSMCEDRLIQWDGINNLKS